MRVLPFLYTGDYDDTISIDGPLSPTGSVGTNGRSTATGSSSDKVDIPRNNLSVYLAANRFHIVPLKQLAKENSLRHHGGVFKCLALVQRALSKALFSILSSKYYTPEI